MKIEEIVDRNEEEIENNREPKLIEEIIESLGRLTWEYNFFVERHFGRYKIAALGVLAYLSRL
jgi:hypothetical protein